MKKSNRVKAFAQFIVAALVLSSCGSSKPIKEEPAKRAEAKLEPVKKCAESIESFQKGHVEKSVAVTECSRMWSNETCRNEWNSAHDDAPTEIMRVCSAAYCPKYPDEKICSVRPAEFDLMSNQYDWFSLWRDFNRKILSDDLGMGSETGIAGDVAVSLLMLVSQPNQVDDLEERSEPAFEVVLQGTEATWRILASSSGRVPDPPTAEFTVPRKNSADQFNPLLEFLKKTGSEIKRAYVNSSEPIDESTRIHILFGLRSIGVTFIEFNPKSRN